MLKKQTITSAAQELQFIGVFENLVRSICQRPKKCEFKHTSGQQVVVTVTPHEDDFGAILGKKKLEPLPGFPKELRTLDALKVIANRMAQMSGLRGGDVVLCGGRDVAFTEQGGAEVKGKLPPRVVPFDPHWKSDEIEALADEVLPQMFHGDYRIAFETVSDVETKMSVYLNADENTGLEMALKSVFAAAGQVGGKKIRLELVTVTDEQGES